MSFMPNDDAVAFGQYIRAFLEDAAAEPGLRHLMESDAPHDVQLWTRAARELGLQGLAVPQHLGGSQAGLGVMGVCFEELGRVLAFAPFLSTVALAATALVQLPEDPDVTELLGGIAAGTCVATVVSSAPDPCASTLTVEDGHIRGEASIAVDGLVADVFLVAARQATGPVGLYLVRAPHLGIVREPVNTLDLTRRLARVRFEQAPARALLEDGREVLARTRDIAWLLLAAEQLGGAQRVLEMALAHAKDRRQFGRRIGSFQAIKHSLADMLVQVEATRSVVYHGLHTAEHDPEALPVEASLARAVASPAYLECASQNIQIHGGIGFTWEHSAHLYLKRAKASSLLFGTTTSARRRLAGLLDLAGAAA